MDNAPSTQHLHRNTFPNTSNATYSDPDLIENRDTQEEHNSEAESVSSSMTASEDFEMDDIDSNHGLEDDEETGLTSNIRSERTSRKRRNTHMDERVSPNVEMKKEEDRLTNRKVWSTILINALLIGLWYAFSISISVVSTYPLANLEHDTETV